MIIKLVYVEEMVVVLEKLEEFLSMLISISIRNWGTEFIVKIAEMGHFYLLILGSADSTLSHTLLVSMVEERENFIWDKVESWAKLCGVLFAV